MDRAVFRDDDMTWTVEHAEEIHRVAPALGLDPAEVADMIQAIRAAEEPIPLVHPEEQDLRENYRIVSGGETVGAVTVVEEAPLVGFGSTWQIDVFVYERARSKGLAAWAVGEVLRQHPERSWEAIVKHDNPFQKHVVSMLERLGFEEQDNVGGRYFVRRP